MYRMIIPFGDVAWAAFPYISRILMAAIFGYLLYVFAVSAPFIFQAADDIYVGTSRLFVKQTMGLTMVMMLFALLAGLAYQASGVVYRVLIAAFRLLDARYGSYRRFTVS